MEMEVKKEFPGWCFGNYDESEEACGRCDCYMECRMETENAGNSEDSSSVEDKNANKAENKN